MNSVILITKQMYDKSNGELNKDWPSASNAMGQSLVLLLFISVVLFFTFYYLKMSKKSKFTKKSRNLEIIESIAVGYQSYIQIIRVSEKFILVGVNKDKITYLSDVENLNMDNIETNNTINFQMSFEKYLKKFVNKDIDIDSEDKKAL